MKVNITVLVLCAGLATVWPASAQNQKEMTQALQRDVAALQDQVRKQDSTLAVIAENLRSMMEKVDRINEKMVAMQTTMTEKVGEISKQVGAPTQALSSKVDGMNDQFLNLSNTVAELNARMGKLDAKLDDVKKMIQTMPVAAPPATAPQQQDAQAAGTPPGAGAVSGEKLYDDATRDYLGNNMDLALQGFAAYVKNFPDAQRTPDAQFYIGEIYIGRQDWDSAIRAFDVVKTNYPDSPRVPMARYRRATALLRAGRRDEASKEFNAIINKYPSTDAAKKSKEYLKLMASPVTHPPAKKSAKHD